MENTGIAIKMEPVTALIVRQVRPGRLNDFEEWLKGMNQAVKVFDGYLGTDLIRPRDAVHPEYVIVVRFDNYEHLRTFMGSTLRQEWLNKSEEMTLGEMEVQEQHGFESWFSLPDLPAASNPPAKFKMALLTILAIYPSLLVISTLTTFLLRGLPRALVMLVTLLILVPLMTYFIMPWVTRLFRFWLYPASIPK